MYRFAVLVFGLVVVGAHHKDASMGIPACARVAHGGFECCNKEITKKPQPSDMEDVKECFQLMKRPPNCDAEICLAKKRGLASDDGTINQKAMMESVEKEFENDPELTDNIKENCIAGNLSKYGPSDICDLLKQKVCIELEIVKSCNEWNDEAGCSGMKELAEECVKQFS